MKKTLKNARMMEMLHQLQPLLSRRDRIGYIAARNCRMLSNSLVEYETIRRELLEKYGEAGTDDRDAPIVQIRVDSPNFKTFSDELAQFNEMEHEVELMTAKYEDVVGALSGEEILAVDWMLED